MNATKQLQGRHHIMPAARQAQQQQAAHRVPAFALGCCWGLPACLHTTPRDHSSCLAPRNAQLTGCCVLLGLAEFRWGPMEAAAINAELDTMIQLLCGYGMCGASCSLSHSAHSSWMDGEFCCCWCGLVCFLLGAHSSQEKACVLPAQTTKPPLGLCAGHSNTQGAALNPWGSGAGRLHSSHQPHTQPFLFHTPHLTPPHPALHHPAHPRTQTPPPQPPPTVLPTALRS
jgi:hypothetical protein